LMQGADVALQSGDFERAESLFQQAVSLCSDANRVQRANVFSLRGTFLIRQGRVDEAKEVLDVALADALAEEIPELAAQCQNALAAIAFQQDRPLEAAELLRAVRDDLVSRVGAQHPDVYVLETNLGFALVNAGRVEEGTVLLERAVAGMERAPEDTVRYLV